jgi:serine/threonine protein kinase
VNNPIAGDAQDLGPSRPSAKDALTETVDETAGRTTEPWPSCELPAPDRVGRYRVVEVLDEGGQGVVLRVIHPELGKDFVLKLARHQASSDPARRNLMMREGRLLAQCEHPNLVRVVDMDFHEGRPYVVMDYVAGPTLQQHAEVHRPGPREAARLVAELAKAVEYIHNRGIVHQDIKPRNIVIDSSGRPKLIDFGLARLRHAWSDEPVGLIGGTPAYMSPEQALLQDEQIGPWTDIFGLGGVLYFLLTERPPYQEQPDSPPTLVQASRAEVVPPRRTNSRVPRSLQRICLKALAGDRRQRYRSAAELERALRRFLAIPWIAAAALIFMATIPPLGLIASRSRPATLSQPVSTPALPVSVASAPNSETAPLAQIRTLEIRHYRGADRPTDLGIIGSSSQQAQLDDLVRAVIRLDRPAHCYLIAFNADGKIQLCAPAEPTTAPSPNAEFDFPADAGSGFALTDGAGLQAFVLIASRAPLPPFAQWSHTSDLHWASVQTEGVWQFDGHRINRVAEASRGEIKKLFDSPRPFVQLCEALQNIKGADAIGAIAFPVKLKTD